MSSSEGINMAGPSSLTNNGVSKAIQVVLGSMERAEEYQRVVTGLKESAAGSGGSVQAEMIDRVLDNGKSRFSW